MTTEGNVVANTVEGTLIKGDYGMFGNTAISANEGIVMNKVTEAADGSITNEEVFKVDKDGNVSTNGAMSVAQGANINGGLAVNGGAAINGGLTVDGTESPALQVNYHRGTTAVGTLSTTPETTVDVYTLTGIRIRHNVRREEALKGLRKGIYIINRQKVILP